MNPEEWGRIVWAVLEQVWGPDLWLAMGFTFLGGVVRGFSGFGAAMMQAPVFAILFTPPQAVATMAGLGWTASLQLAPGVLREVDWREILPITVIAGLAVPLGAYILLALDAVVMRRGISALVLLMVMVLMTGWRYPAKPGLAGSLATGGLSGLINGASGVGGPPVVLYLLVGPNPARTNRANLITYYIFLNGITVFSLYFHGAVNETTLGRIALLLPAQFVSLWAGSWLFRRATDAIYRKIALALLLAVALFGLLYT